MGLAAPVSVIKRPNEVNNSSADRWVIMVIVLTVVEIMKINIVGLLFVI